MTVEHFRRIFEDWIFALLVASLCCCLTRIDFWRRIHQCYYYFHSLLRWPQLSQRNMEKEGRPNEEAGPGPHGRAKDETMMSSSDNDLAPFNPTCDHALRVALDMLLSEDDDDGDGDGGSSSPGPDHHRRRRPAPPVLFDLGCGDGRLLIAAVRRDPSVRCVGVERDPALVGRAAAAAARERLTAEQRSRLEFRLGDALLMAAASPSSLPPPSSSLPPSSARDDASSASVLGSRCRDLQLEDATAIYLYLLPRGLVKMQPMLDQLVGDGKPASKLRVVVTYMFRVRGWEPMRVDRTTKAEAPVYLYRLPTSKKQKAQSKVIA